MPLIWLMHEQDALDMADLPTSCHGASEMAGVPTGCQDTFDRAGLPTECPGNIQCYMHGELLALLTGKYLSVLATLHAMTRC